MKIVSFNTNGIRVREHQLERLKARYDPDVIGIQETKVHDDEFPVEMVEALGYQARYFGQKGHYGVALLSKKDPVTLQKGYPFDEPDAQRRLICGEYESESGARIKIINGYFPQGDSRDHETKFPAKRRFYSDLMRYLREHCAPSDQLLVIGDMNIARLDIDIGIGAENAKRWLKSGKCSFLPEERGWMDELLDWGLKDTYRSLYPDSEDNYSWFDYRSKGFDREPRHGLRIDLILASQALQNCCTGAGIAYDIRGMERPSDHCPIWAEFAI